MSIERQEVEKKRKETLSEEKWIVSKSNLEVKSYYCLAR